MKLSPSLVAVRKIISTVPRSNFSDTELERAAHLILEAEGVINPLVLRRTSIDSYEVVDGHFEYYAAARAREINLRQGEMIGAFIIEEEKEETIDEQVKLLRKPKSTVISTTNTDTNISESRLLNLESRQTNFESRFETRTSELRAEYSQKIQFIQDRLQELENRLPQPIEPLKALNSLGLTELTSRLRKISISVKTVEKIVNERHKNGEFKSCSDAVSRVKGLGEKTMIKIIDYFSEYTS
jgi:ParB family chromosome partitioning protein